MKRVCLYIDGEGVSIVDLRSDPHRIKPEKAFTIPLSELDSFLSVTEYDDFIVTCNFRDLRHEIITVPSVNRKYLHRIISLEVKKLSDGGDYAYVYYDLGERIVEQRRVRDISIIMVSKKEINDLIERFLRYKKSIRHIYASLQSALALLRNDKRTLLCVFETGTMGGDLEKNVFLMKDGKLFFFRRLTSFNKGLSDIDIKGIEMSIAHCEQVLRIQPEGVMIIGDTGEILPDSIKGLPVSSVKGVNRIDMNDIQSEYLRYLIPTGSMLCSKDEDMSTDDYKSFRFMKKILEISIMVFALLSVFFLFISIYNIKEIISIRDERHFLEREERRLSGVIAEYRETVSEARSLESILNFLKERRFFPSRIFTGLSGLRLNNIEFSNLEMDLTGDTIRVRILGRVRAEDYTVMLESFNDLIDSLKGLSGVEIVSKGFRLADGTFNIDVRFR